MSEGRRFVHVMPLAFINYALAYLDRVNMGSAQSAMSKSLHLGENMAPTLQASFFVGYCLLQIPAAIFAAKRQKVKWFIFWALLLWGFLSALTGVIRNVPLLIADRVALGAVEGIVLPVMLIYLTRWFTRPERSRSNALLMLANPVTMTIASALCGWLIQHFDKVRFGQFEGWQMMFIVEGLPSVVWAFVWLYAADESPADAKWLTPREARSVQATLDKEQRRIPTISNFWKAFADRRVLIIGGMFLGLNSASYGLSLWLPTIVADGWGQKPALVGYLTAIPYFIAIFSAMAVAWASDRSLRRKRYAVGGMYIGGVAYIVAYLAVAHITGRYAFLIAFLALIVTGSCNYTPTAPTWAWLAEILPRNVVGESMALINTFGAVGGFLGTLLAGMLKKHYSSGAAFAYLAGSFLLAGLLGSLVGDVPRDATEEPRGFEVITPGDKS